MSINIKTSAGLLEIGGSVTKEKIIAALECVPADEKVVNSHINNSNIHVTAEDKARWDSKDYGDLENLPNITDDESGNLTIADNNGNAIARFDEDGLTTTNVNTKTLRLNGEDLSVLLDEIESGILPNILDNESGDFVVADDNGNVILKVDDSGLETTFVTARGMSVNGTDVESKIADHAESIDEIDNNLNAHIANSTPHITNNERTIWNNKSNFSGNYSDLAGAPNITEDESGEVIYTDEDGHIILKVGAEGAETTQVTANVMTVAGADVGAHIADTDIHTAYTTATTSKAGLMSASDKFKLNGIAAEANAYTLPAATSSTLGGIKVTLIGTTLIITT